jgi:hypothetical protein
MKTPAAHWAIPLACAVVGGVAGHFAFLWIARQGFYAVALPGLLVGLAGGAFLSHRSPGFAVISGVIGLLAGVVSEWRFAPFISDGSFSYFITHLHQLRPITWIMIALGVACAAWFGLGRAPRARPTG